MDRATKYGLTDQFMKDAGKTIKQMAEADSFMQTGISMMVFGKMIKHMDLAIINTQIIHNIKEIG